MDGNLNDIDGDSEREIVRKIYDEVCKVSDKQGSMCQTQKEILDRMEKAESVTDPIRDIADSTWNNLVYMLGWGVLALIAVGVYYLMKMFGKI